MSVVEHVVIPPAFPLSELCIKRGNPDLGPHDDFRRFTLDLRLPELQSFHCKRLDSSEDDRSAKHLEKYENGVYNFMTDFVRLARTLHRRPKLAAA